MVIIEWIVIGFFSAIGWKGADYMFEKIGTEPTSISQTIEKDIKDNQKQEKKDEK